MKYRARIEKLDWTGKIKVTYREYEDNFKPNTDKVFEEFIKTGNFPVKKLKKPQLFWWDLAKHLAPSKSDRSFSEYDTGLRIIASEYFAGAGVQFVVSSPNKDDFCAWKETDSDIVEKTDGN